VVTRLDIEAALARRIAAGTPEAEPGQTSCDYAGRYGQVSIVIEQLGRKPDLAAEIAAMERTIPDSKVRDAPGLAAPAFYLDIPGAGTQLHVLFGERDYLMVSVLGFGAPADVSAAARRIARSALERLATRHSSHRESPAGAAAAPRGTS
jgi:hypothetical protein